MTFVDELLSTFGFGQATITTKVYDADFIKGEDLYGCVSVKGGKIQQKISDITIALCTTFEGPRDNVLTTKEMDLLKDSIAKDVIVHPNEELEFPFSIKIPLDTPVSKDQTKVWIDTELDIKYKPNPKNKIILNVQPNKLMQACIDKLSELGFNIREVKCEPAPDGWRKDLRIIQEFEFAPVDYIPDRKVNQIEVLFITKKDHIKVLVDINRKKRGFNEYLYETIQRDPEVKEVIITNDNIDIISEKVEAFINQYHR